MDTNKIKLINFIMLLTNIRKYAILPIDKNLNERTYLYDLS